MNHNPFRQLGIRLAAFAVIFLIFFVVVYYMGLPQPWVWSMMATMLFYKMIMSKAI